MKRMRIRSLALSGGWLVRSVVLVAAVAVGLHVAPALANLTQVYDTTYGGEKDLHFGLDTHPDYEDYGGCTNGFSDALDDLYGTGNYLRIDDSFDELWVDMDGSVQCKAIYAGDYHYLGYSLDETNGTNPVWLDPGDGRLDEVGESATFNIEPDSDVFIWRLGCGPEDTYYSNRALNLDGLDHMVTFKITSMTDTYVIAFDNGGGDQDYQDFIYELQNVGPLPEPATMLLFGLGSLCLMRKRRV